LGLSNRRLERPSGNVGQHAVVLRSGRVPVQGMVKLGSRCQDVDSYPEQQQSGRQRGNPRLTPEHAP